MVTSLLAPTVPVMPGYSYEEFAAHLKAMKMVQGWEFTLRFGPVGQQGDLRAHNARVIEYFCDCYIDRDEALRKAEMFLSICDYLGRNIPQFSKWMEAGQNELLVDPALLRAVHHIFTSAVRPYCVEPKKVLNLARAFQDVR